MFGWDSHSKASSGPQAVPDVRTGSDELEPLLTAIEALAIRLYQEHDLPGVPGHYRRLDDMGPWELVSHSLTPAQKFDLILQASEEDSRWHYAAYEALGARHENLNVRKAAALLAACHGIRIRVDQGATLTAQTLADAMKLGATYQALATSLPGETPLPDLLKIKGTPIASSGSEAGTASEPENEA